jgi:hypothetical protein
MSAFDPLQTLASFAPILVRKLLRGTMMAKVFWILHFSAEQLRGYSRVYQIIDRISELEPKDEAAWTTLFELAGPGRPFDAQDARVYRTAVGQAREINGLMSGFGVREQQAVDGYHVPYDATVLANKGAIPKGLKLYCGPPTGVSPSTYGAAPDTHFPDYALQHPTK